MPCPHFEQCREKFWKNHKKVLSLSYRNATPAVQPNGCVAQKLENTAAKNYGRAQLTENCATCGVSVTATAESIGPNIVAGVKIN